MISRSGSEINLGQTDKRTKQTHRKTAFLRTSFCGIKNIDEYLNST